MALEEAVIAISENLEEFSINQSGIFHAVTFVLAQILAAQCFDAEDPMANAIAGRARLLEMGRRSHPKDVPPGEEENMERVKVAAMQTLERIGNEVVRLVSEELRR